MSETPGCDGCEMLCMETTVGEAFCQFHNANPRVYEKLRELASKMRRKGKQKWGMKGLFEVLRWEVALETTDEEFKLRNAFTPWYSRLLMREEPELRGFFNLSKSEADGALPIKEEA